MNSNVNKNWYFKFSVNDFLSSPDVAVMTADEVGQYMLLLCYQWQSPQCGLENNLPRLAALARATQVSPLVLGKFSASPDDGLLRNERLYSEWIEAQQRSTTAKNKANTRWNATAHAPALPEQCRGNASQSHSQSNSHSQTDSLSTPATSADSAVSPVSQSGQSDGQAFNDGQKSVGLTDGRSLPSGATPSTLPKRVIDAFVEHTKCNSALATQKWIDTLRPLLEDYDEQQLNKILSWAFQHDKWWIDTARRAKNPVAYLVKGFPTMAQQYEAQRTFR